MARSVYVGDQTERLIAAGMIPEKAGDFVQGAESAAVNSGNSGPAVRAVVVGLVDGKLAELGNNGRHVASTTPTRPSNGRRPTAPTEPTPSSDDEVARRPLIELVERARTLTSQILDERGEVGVTELSKILAREMNISPANAASKIRVMLVAHAAEFRVLTRSTIVRAPTTKSRGKTAATAGGRPN